MRVIIDAPWYRVVEALAQRVDVPGGEPDAHGPHLAEASKKGYWKGLLPAFRGRFVGFLFVGFIGRGDRIIGHRYRNLQIAKV